MLPARRDYAFIVANPHPGADPVARLKHVNARFAGMDPDEFAIVATVDVYRDGDTTGLTYGDLRVLAERIAPKGTLTRAAKERAVAEMASRLAGIAENTGYADMGKIPDVDYFHRRQRTLRAALVRLAMARTVD